MTESAVTYWQQLLTVPNLRTCPDLFEIVCSNIEKWWLFSKDVVVSCEKAVQGNMFLNPVIEGKSELITISAVVLTRFSFLLLQNKKKTPNS